MSTALAISRPGAHELKTMNLEAAMLAKSTLIPEALRRKPEEIMTIALMGRVLGLDMVSACLYIPVVKGRPFVESKALGAVLNHRGYQWMFEESSSTSCTVMGRHPNDPEGWPLRRLTFTIEDAKRAGLAESDTYKKHPADMLRHRALGKWVRANCPEILTGLGAIGIAGVIEEGDNPDEVEAQTKRDAEVVDAELVVSETVSVQNETYQLVSQQWITWWHAQTGKFGLNDDEKHAIIATATGGRCSSSVDIRESEKEAVKAELTAHLATRETSAA
jgi:hypothetical protein